VAGIDNSGQVIGNIAGSWSGDPNWYRARNWMLRWSPDSYGQPALLAGIPDSNDRDLPVDDSPRLGGFISKHVEGVEAYDMGGHFRNQSGLDDIGGFSAINNANQIVGGIYHSQSLNQWGFPIISNSGVATDVFNEVPVWTNGIPEAVARGTYKGAAALNDDGVIVGTDVIFEQPNYGVPHTLL